MIQTDEQIDTLARFLRERAPVTVLTGAGCSTDSGIPAYRDGEGVWQGRAPVHGQEFRASAEARRRYWSRSILGWPGFSVARPNEAHYALAALERAGLIDKIGVRWIHSSVHSAVEFCTAHRSHVEVGGDPGEPEESAGHGAAVHGGKTLVSWPAITARLRLPRREPRRPACTSDEAVPTESQAAAV